jgi:hypothetical protein
MKRVLLTFVFCVPTGLAQTRPPLEPGVYELRPMHVPDLCIGAERKFWTGSCGRYAGAAELRQRLLNVLPHPAGGVTIRPGNLSFITGLDERYPTCATVARGVVPGAADIDVHPCDFPVNSTSWCEAGAPDQRFTLVRVGPSVYEIHDSTGQCWDVRGQSREFKARISRWKCDGQANQRFEFRRVGDITATEELNCLARGAANVEKKPPTGELLGGRESKTPKK